MATKYIVNNVTGQTINGESILPKYKVYTALLTQSGVDDPTTITGGSVTEGVSYLLLDVFDGGTWDFSNVGGPVHPEYYSFVSTSNEEPNSWDGVGMLGYNTAAPIVTVLENTIGNIWFTYDNIGTYLVNSNGLFTTDKTWAQSTVINTNPEFCIFNLGNDLVIEILSGNDGSLSNTSIEIRVYN